MHCAGCGAEIERAVLMREIQRVLQLIYTDDTVEEIYNDLQVELDEGRPFPEELE